MVNGRFLAEDSTAPAGQEIVLGLLERCFLWSEIVLLRCVSLVATETNKVYHNLTMTPRLQERKDR